MVIESGYVGSTMEVHILFMSLLIKPILVTAPEVWQIFILIKEPW